jgi:UDPglucose 6-dehydrogenase
MAEGAGLHPGLLRSVIEINRESQRRFVSRAEELLGGLDQRRIGIWGLSFKENTDDLRESPAVAVVEMLLERGASVIAHDPAAASNAAERLPQIELAENAYEAARDVDALLLCTPWPEYTTIEYSRIASLMHGDLLLDGRNLLDKEQVEGAGLRYEGIGRGRERLATPQQGHSIPRQAV